MVLRCRNTLFFGLLATFYVAISARGSQYSANMFLNGDYKNNAKAHQQFSINPTSNIFLEHAIISRQAAPFQGPTYLPPVQFIKCSGGQQCVRKNVCQNGYYTQKQNPIANCNPESDVCCSYRPPATPPPTTPKPYITCRRDQDCVSPNDCQNGEIVSTNYIHGSSSNSCYAPNVCCLMPSTTLTENGYQLKVPDTKFPLPSIKTPVPTPTRPPTTYTKPPTTYTQPPPKVTQPTNEYLPPAPTTRYTPQPPQPQTPRYTPQPPQPQTPRYTPPPQQPQTPRYTPQPETPRYTPPPQQPQTPRYTPQPPQPPTTRYTPPPPQTPSKPTNEYLPPAPTTRYTPQPPQQPPSTRYTPQPPQQPPSTRYTPQPPQPTTQRPYTPQPTQPRRTTPNRNYLPPGDKEIKESQESRTVTKKVTPTPPPPRRGESVLSPQITPNINVERSPAKCASALVCTAEDYCNSIGVVSDTPVDLSPEARAYRVPLTDCIMPDTGSFGKCCRDPNYVDPWPVNMAGVCGTRNRGTKPQGISELDANFGEIPWQAMILKQSTKQLLCGGAIIGAEHVLTTAECVKGLSESDCRIKAGEWELGNDSEPLPFQIVGAKYIKTHPTDDMAIIRLDKPLQFAPHIKPICISDQDPSSSEKCVTTGWGKQAIRAHEQGAIMHVTDTDVLSRSECGASQNSVCSSTKYDSCQFDTGSALACGSSSSVFLKGIFSAENNCGEGQAVRFTKPDIKWINEEFGERNKAIFKRFN